MELDSTIKSAVRMALLHRTNEFAVTRSSLELVQRLGIYALSLTCSRENRLTHTDQ